MLDVLSGRDRVYRGLCYCTHISPCLRCVVLSAKGCVESLTPTRDMALVVLERRGQLSPYKPFMLGCVRPKFKENAFDLIQWLKGSGLCKKRVQDHMLINIFIYKFSSRSKTFVFLCFIQTNGWLYWHQSVKYWSHYFCWYILRNIV